MGVVRTDKWLRIYCQKWHEADTLAEKMSLQRQVMIEPLSEIFKTKETQALQQYLFQVGLTHPDVASDLELKQWLNKHPWKEVQKQLTYLQKKWKGPDVKLYLLPIEKRNPFLMKQLGGKMGITLPHAILLFIHGEIRAKELLALVTHEYHHVCRLRYTKQSEESMSLLESMVMEGLAEYAVKEELGTDANAAWTKCYDLDWNRSWFEQWIRPNLFLKGRKNHHMYLYGDDQTGIPLWLGYYTGYRLINSAVTETDATRTLFEQSAEALFEQSAFKGERGGGHESDGSRLE